MLVKPGGPKNKLTYYILLPCKAGRVCGEGQGKLRQETMPTVAKTQDTVSFGHFSHKAGWRDPHPIHPLPAYSQACRRHGFGS